MKNFLTYIPFSSHPVPYPVPYLIFTFFCMHNCIVLYVPVNPYKLCNTVSREVNDLKITHHNKLNFQNCE